MKLRLLFFSLLFIVFTTVTFAQQQPLTIPVPYEWTAPNNAPDPNNPIKYWFYVCTDAALTTCIKEDAGTATMYTKDMATGTYWVYVTAYRYAISADNPEGPHVGGPLEESGKSNIVGTRVTIPPGNPSNAKVRIQ